MTLTGELRVLVVVPAFNEAESLGSVVSRIREIGFQVVVVDDGSEDQTSDVARAAGARVLTLPINLGVGGALQCGFRYAIENGYQVVVQCDADGQHSPDHISSLVQALTESGASLVIGSRFRSLDNKLMPSAVRRIPMRLMAAIASRATGTTITDATSGFRAIRRPLLDEFAEHFPVHYLGDTFEALCGAGKAGYEVVEIGVPMAERQHGKSSATSARAVGLIAKSILSTLLGFQAHVPPRQHS